MGVETIETRINPIQTDIDPIESYIKPITQSSKVDDCRQFWFGWYMGQERACVSETEHLLKSSIQGILLCTAGHVCVHLSCPA